MSRDVGKVDARWCRCMPQPCLEGGVVQTLHGRAVAEFKQSERIRHLFGLPHERFGESGLAQLEAFG